MHKYFATQLDNEKIFGIIRQHWIFLALKIKIWALLVILYSAGWWFGSNFVTENFSEASLAVFHILMYVFALILLLSLLIIIMLYHLHLQIITDIRIVDVDQIGILSRRVTELQLENVEDVTSESHGLLATMFDIGTVTVQTSSAKTNFEFENTAHPEHVKKLILDLYEKRRHSITPKPPETTQPKPQA